MENNEQVILEGLNEEQKAAVTAPDGPVLVIAGAGSGKTRVLTTRIAYLISKGEDPSRILALTFTRKAADEMRSRIGQLTDPNKAKLIVMGTFHSVFVRFLRKYATLVGFTPDFSIYDTDASQSCLKDCIGRHFFGESWNDKDVKKGLPEEEKMRRKEILTKFNPKDIGSWISLQKNNYVLPKDLEDYQKDKGTTSNQEVDLVSIYRKYVETCKMNNAMDFDDILVYMYTLLKEHPEIAEAFSANFKYILVDEFQDTNELQNNIVSLLTKIWNNIFAVGDDSQSIYAFRGAKIENIIHFADTYGKPVLIKLKTNYRSTPTIVDAANNLIANNTNRIPKTCKANRTDEKAIVLQTLANERSEAKFIAESIINKRNNGANYNDFAVLYRTNAQSRAIEEALIRSKIPYVIWSGTSFFDRQEIKDALAYIKLVLNPSDDEAYKRICNRPARGISEATLAALQEFAVRNKKTLSNAADIISTYSCSLKQIAIMSLRGFNNIISSLRRKTKQMNAFDAVKSIIEDSGILKLYEEMKDEDDGRKRSNNIRELVNGVMSFIEEQDEKGDPDSIRLSDWLDNITLLTDMDHKKKKTDSVVLMTSHCSKGLEFPVVYVAGVEEGLYPSIKKDDNDKGDSKNRFFQLEEERRLFYVSVTRAKDELILLNCIKRWNYNQYKECTESRFISELKTEFDFKKETPPKESHLQKPNPIVHTPTAVITQPEYDYVDDDDEDDDDDDDYFDY